MTIVWIFALWLGAALTISGCNSPKAEGPKFDFNETKPQTGELSKKGQHFRLKLHRQVKLDTDGPGFMVHFDKLIYRDDRFYAIGRSNTEVIVYGTQGNYLKTIQIKPRPKPGCAFADIAKHANGSLFIKDINSSKILEVDSSGQVLFRISTRSPSGEGNVQICPGGLEIIDSPSGRIVFSSIFQWMDDLTDVLTENTLIGRFNHQGILEQQFAKHDPIVGEFGLLSHQRTTFTVYKNEIYLLEQPLPYVRVFSFEGQLKRRFGAKSPRHRQLEREPLQMTFQENVKFIHRHTLNESVNLVVSVGGFEQAVVAVYYANALISNENLSREYNKIERDHYLAIYTLDGELLENDVAIPGQLLYVDKNSNLVILLSDRPDNRVIGLYSLALHATTASSN